MSLVQELKLRFANFLLNRHNFRPGLLNSPLNLDKARTIGIVFKAGSKADTETIKAMSKSLNEQGKTVYMLEFFDSDENTDNLLKTKHYSFITRKDLTFLNLPKKHAIADFAAHDFDITMAFCFDKCLSIHYAMAVAKADFKIGLYSPEYAHIYDFMIQDDQQSSIQYAIHTLQYYLNSIHKN